MKTQSEMMREILYGVAVGDALGFPVQFKSREQRNSNPLVDMGKLTNDNGSAHAIDEDEIGLWSDDTSLTLCLAESLLTGFSLKDQSEKYIAWLETGYYSALDSAFDVGFQTSRQLKKVKKILLNRDYQQLSKLRDSSEAETNGNGSLMRILPLLIYIKGKDIVEQFDLVWQVSALTHPHIRSALACMCYLKMAEYIVNGFNKTDAYRKTQRDILLLMDNVSCPGEEYRVFSRLLNESIGKLKEVDIKSDGYVISSLEAAIWCILNTNSYSEAVLKAVNLGWDTDTTAAITGGMAALLYGIEDIPQGWIAVLYKRDCFETLLSRYVG